MGIHIQNWLGHAFRTPFSEKELPNRHDGYPVVVKQVKGGSIEFVMTSSRNLTMATMDIASFASIALPDFKGHGGMGNIQELIRSSSDMEQVNADGMKWLRQMSESRLSKEPQKIVFPSGQVLPFKVYTDWNANSCIELHRDNGFIFFIALVPGKKMEKQSAAARAFEGDWKPLTRYPAAKAAQFYLDYASLGVVSAEKAALNCLKQIINPTEEDMTEEAKTEKKAKAPKKDKAPKKAAKGKAAKKEGKTREGSAAATFKELILKGTLTDDQIFAQAQKKHGLDDSKRSYVAWYRNNLRKSGVKVPDAKK